MAQILADPQVFHPGDGRSFYGGVSCSWKRRLLIFYSDSGPWMPFAVGFVLQIKIILHAAGRTITFCARKKPERIASLRLLTSARFQVTPSPSRITVQYTWQ
jgi:hypothetical protein